MSSGIFTRTVDQDKVILLWSLTNGISCIVVMQFHLSSARLFWDGPLHITGEIPATAASTACLIAVAPPVSRPMAVNSSACLRMMSRPSMLTLYGPSRMESAWKQRGMSVSDQRMVQSARLSPRKPVTSCSTFLKLSGMELVPAKHPHKPANGAHSNPMFRISCNCRMHGP